MIKTNNYKGDLYLYNTTDGGEISNKNGSAVLTQDFETACYLSLFGHIGEASTYWGNEYLPEEKKLSGQFMNYVSNNPKTSNTIGQAEEYALLDLQWFIDDKICSDIEISIASTDINRIDMYVIFLQDGNIVFQTSYATNWDAMKNNPASKRI
jgi:phage gp46-like protein